MNTSEATQLLSWLEEERRRDKTLLTELRKRVEEHQDQFAGIAERVEGLEEDLAHTGAELARMSRFDRAVQQFKDEILLELQRYEERFAKRSHEVGQSVGQERQDRAKALATLGERIDEALRLQEAVQTQEAEIRRLTKAASVSKLQMDELLKDGKERQEKLSFLESWVEGGGEQMAALQAFGERLREEQGELVDQLRKADDRRAKQIDAWAKEMAVWREEGKKVRELSALVDKQYRNAEKMLTTLDTLRIQLEQDREALHHMERTAEERQRQQLEEWRKENELLWLRDEERWQRLAEENDTRDAHITQLWESQLEHTRHEVGELAKWIREVEKRLLHFKK